MRYKKYYLFKTIYWGIIILLGFMFFYYNKNYWMRYVGNFEAYETLFYFARILIVIFIAAMLVFRKFIFKKRKEFGLLLISLVILFSFFEIGSRVYLCNFTNEDFQARMLLYGQCGKIAKYGLHHYLNYQENPDYESSDGLNVHNSFGWRGPEVEVPKPDGVYRIVTLGGSTTYSISVKNWRKDFARQLEKELKEKGYENVEVINAGIGGATSWESLINLEFRVLETEPNMIIVYHGVNDVRMRVVEPEKYASDNSGARKQWEEPKIPFLFKSSFVRMATGINPSSLNRFIAHRSSVSGINEGENYIGVVELFEENKPIYFERNLRSMVAVAREHGADVVLSTWAHTNLLGGRVASPYYEKGIGENNKVVLKVGEITNTPVYDFASEMPSDKIYWSDGLHLNEEGVELKAKLFAEFIEEEELIEE